MHALPAPLFTTHHMYSFHSPITNLLETAKAYLFLASLIKFWGLLTEVGCFFFSFLKLQSLFPLQPELRCRFVTFFFFSASLFSDLLDDSFLGCCTSVGEAIFFMGVEDNVCS